MRGLGPRWVFGLGVGLLGALGMSLVGLAGCGELGERQRFEHGRSGPGPGDRGGRCGATRVDLCLSAEIDPRALDDLDVTLHSGDLTFDSQQEVQLIAWRAPGSRSELAASRWCPGSVISLTPTSRSSRA